MKSDARKEVQVKCHGAQGRMLLFRGQRCQILEKSLGFFSWIYSSLYVSVPQSLGIFF